MSCRFCKVKFVPRFLAASSTRIATRALGASCNAQRPSRGSPAKLISAIVVSPSLPVFYRNASGGVPSSLSCGAIRAYLRLVTRPTLRWHWRIHKTTFVLDFDGVLQETLASAHRLIHCEIIARQRVEGIFASGMDSVKEVVAKETKPKWSQGLVEMERRHILTTPQEARWRIE